LTLATKESTVLVLSLESPIGLGQPGHRHEDYMSTKAIGLKHARRQNSGQTEFKNNFSTLRRVDTTIPQKLLLCFDLGTPTE
jgi:hypothetical protein